MSRSRAQGLNRLHRLHRLMTELIPGGLPVKKSVPQYQTMLAGVRPRDAIGRTVRRLAAAADRTPHIGTSYQPQPEPAPPTLPTPTPAQHPSAVSTAAPSRQRAKPRP